MIINPGLIRGTNKILATSSLTTDLSGKLPGGAATFTRGSSQYATGDSIVQQAVTNMPMFPGIRAVTNLWTESEFRNGLTDAPTRSANITATTLAGYAGAIYFPAGATSAQYVYKTNFTSVNTRKYLLFADIQMEDLSIPRSASNIDTGSSYDVIAIVFNGSGTLTAYHGYLSLGNNVYRLFWSGTANGSNTLAGVAQYPAMSDKAFKVSAYNLVDITGIPTTQAIEYVQTTTAQVTKFYAYTNPYTVSNGIVTQGSGTPLSSQGFLSEPSGTNKCTCYGVPRADSISAELFAGTASGTNWVDNGNQTFTGTAVTGVLGLTLTTAVVVGNIYRMSFTVSAGATGYVRARAGTNYGLSASAGQTITTDVLAVSTIAVYIYGVGFTGTVSNVSVKVITDLVGDTYARYDTNASAFVNNIPNMTLSGDTSAVLSIVDDTAALTSAGLLGLTNGGKVYKLDNSGGAAITTATVGGAVANTNSHTLSAYIRDGGSGGTLRINAGSLVTTVNNTVYSKKEISNFTPSSTGQALVVGAAAGSVAYFILPQLEENPYTSTLMPSAGSAGSRAATALSLPVTGNLPVGTTGVTNLVRYSQDFSNAAWVKAGTATVTGTNVINLPANLDNVLNTTTTNVVVGQKILVSAKLSGSGTTSLMIYSGGGAAQYYQINLTSSPTVYSNVFTANFAGTLTVYIRRNSGTSDTATQVICDWYQAEDVATSGKTAFTTYTPTTSASATDYPTTRHISFNWTPQYAGLLAPSGYQLPQYLWSTRVDASNYTAIWYNGTILAFEKMVGGVSEFAVYPLTAVVGTTYKIDGLINADNTLTIKVNGVAGASGVGSEIIPHPVDITQVSPWGYITNGTKTSATVATATTTSLYVATSSAATTRGKAYQFLCTGALSGAGAMTIIQSGVLAYVTIGQSGVTRSTVLQQQSQSIGFRATSTTAGDTITISEFSVKEIYNNTTTMAPQIGSTMEIGSLNGVSNAYANFSNFAISKR